MLTKEVALARLRTTGSLASEKRLAITIAAADARTPLPRSVSYIMTSNERATGPRHVAPSSNQVVLP